MFVRFHNLNFSVQTSTGELPSVGLHLKRAMVVYCSIELLRFLGFTKKLIV